MRTSLTLATILVALLASAYQFHFKKFFRLAGIIGRSIEAVGNSDCRTIPELSACEKLVLHEPTGLVYAACSTPLTRQHWTPAILLYNSTELPTDNYIATFDPHTGKVTHLTLSGFDASRGFYVHGMDVVASASDPTDLYVYIVNHRPFLGKDAHIVGADSVVEIFQTKSGSHIMTHLRTVEDNAVLISPNDVIGSPDGKSFHFTNDRNLKTVSHIKQTLEVWSLSGKGSVGHCHLDHGCKIVLNQLPTPNGIARGQNDTVYVVNSIGGEVLVLELQSDDSLVLTDTITLDRCLDNISVDSGGHLWVAGFPKGLVLQAHFENPKLPSPTTAIRVSLNTGPGLFYGQKYQVTKAFEDDGRLASGATSAVFDKTRRLLFLDGLMSPALTVCKM